MVLFQCKRRESYVEILTVSCSYPCNLISPTIVKWKNCYYTYYNTYMSQESSRSYLSLPGPLFDSAKQQSKLHSTQLPAYQYQSAARSITVSVSIISYFVVFIFSVKSLTLVLTVCDRLYTTCTQRQCMLCTVYNMECSPDTLYQLDVDSVFSD